ncbi:hypothetical protein HanHA300_Chr02g0041021 [Helianthus annuus]|nr:hypothetical protein HanHA300_Chr02g0041021 [Helianthus annuus]KAJ0617656.1 hypothetical protein HanHA89_Chr02g0044241 [Helianthus annuus]KAJ0950565.1 hypothetical protein HanPSC8_Chr02g0049701 [Helianthus annuus]
MATSAFKSTTRRPPFTTSSPSTDDSPASSSSKPHRRSRSVSRFSRPIQPDIESGVVPTPTRNFGGSDFPEISLDDLAIEFFSNGSEFDDESVSSRTSRRDRVKPELTPVESRRRSRSVSRCRNGVNSAVAGSGGAVSNSSSQRRGRSVSRRNDGNFTASNVGSEARVVSNGDLRRRRSVSVARHQISDSESDIDFSRSSASQPKSRSMNNGNDRVASYRRPTASSHRRLTRSMSQAPQLRPHDGYSSHSSALTDEDLRDARYGRNEIEKTIRAVYAQKKIDHPTGDDANNGIYEAMRKELRSAVNEIMIELEQNMERKPSASSVHDRLYLNGSDATTRKFKQPEKRKQDLSTERVFKEQQSQDGYKIVREVVPKSKSNAKAPSLAHPRKRSNDRSRMSKRLNEEAEKYFEDFLSNVEDTDFSSFDGERSDTSSTLLGSTTKQNRIPVEMEGVNLPWLKWDDNDGVRPTTAKTKLWDPSQDLKFIQEHRNGSSSSRGNWNPEHTPANSTDMKGNKFNKMKSPRFDMGRYLDLERTEELLFDSWRDRSVIMSGGLLLCPLLKPY